ncbi:hypothetical protein OG252_13200 [Streptomyces sp. NBC_01352]|uniref:hypothetical protein n=1 Tax=Streptomyces sp. NBC_01352 TaxID=2903834 RepID=UPI002E301F8E|nr:hypothetical protein [Streptomyces sp. NBC_01352]
MIAAVGGFLLALVCIAIVALAFGLAVAAWSSFEPTWGPRIARGTAVTVGVTCLLLAAFPVIGQVLP